MFAENTKLQDAIKKCDEFIAVLKELDANVGFEKYSDSLGFAHCIKKDLEEIACYNGRVETT